MRVYFSFFVILFICSSAHSQTQHQSSGWLMFMNNTKINKHWGGYLDMQLRSGHQWENVRHILVRPGVTYYVNNRHELTLGYLLNNTYTHLNGTADNVLTEHRIWQQYIFKHKISNVNATHRFRLEQRFIERAGKDELFAQRLRYFVRFIIPLEKEVKNFEEGFFAALQNELFFNVQHKNELNHKIFDQNRAYVAGGYRFSKALDIEAGYLNQSIKGLQNNTINNVIQLAIYTRF